MLFQLIADWFAPLSSDAKEFVKTGLGPTVAILLFVLTNVVQGVLAARTRRNEVKRIVRGIYREIAENLEYADKDVDAHASTIALIKQRITEDDARAAQSKSAPVYRPLIGITDSSKFYDTVAGSLPSIKADSLVAISAYYRKIADQHLAAAAVDSYAFLYISVESRRGTIDDLYAAFAEARSVGQSTLAQLERDYGSGSFTKLKAKPQPEPKPRP